MKISKIIIPEYRQFKNFELDLTYPEGHPKAGQPLDKVCLIGQSGTGKTTLLNIFKKFVDGNKETNNDITNAVRCEVISGTQKLFAAINNNTNYRSHVVSDKTISYSSDLIKGFLAESYFPDGAHLLNFPAELIDNFNQILQKDEKQNPLFYFKTAEEIDNYLTEKENKLRDKKIFDFGKDNVADVWSFILRKNQDFWEEEVKWKNKIADTALKEISNVAKLLEEYKSWKQNTINPIQNIADKLNIILSHFQLEIVKEFEYTRKEDLDFIQIQSINGIKVGFNGWSTGTKQILLNSLPLINLNIENAIILMDEPERSLYPDIQRKIVDFYTGIAPKAQFFIATHSPIIAASFEPWEIVELVFDDDGFVLPRKYYEGNRHIDNYFIDFRYLRWDDILMKGFGMDEEGNSFFREREMMKATRLRKRLEKMRAEGSGHTPEYETSLSEYLTSAKKIGWSNEKD